MADDLDDFFSTDNSGKKDEKQPPAMNSSLLDSIIDFNEFSTGANVSTITPSNTSALDVLALLDLNQNPTQANQDHSPFDAFTANTTTTPFDAFGPTTTTTPAEQPLAASFGFFDDPKITQEPHQNPSVPFDHASPEFPAEDTTHNTEQPNDEQSKHSTESTEQAQETTEPQVKRVFGSFSAHDPFESPTQQFRHGQEPVQTENTTPVANQHRQSDEQSHVTESHPTESVQTQEEPQLHEPQQLSTTDQSASHKEEEVTTSIQEPHHKVEEVTTPTQEQHHKEEEVTTPIQEPHIQETSIPHEQYQEETIPQEAVVNQQEEEEEQHQQQQVNETQIDDAQIEETPQQEAQVVETTPKEEVGSDIPSDLKCVYCNSLYTTPKLLLPCLHTYCQKCISDFTTKGVKYCQVCKTEIELPVGGVASLPDDFMANSKLGVASLKDQKPKPCDLCDETNSDAAIVYCKECTRFLCNDHMNTHKKDRNTKSHAILTMEEFKADIELQTKTNKTVFCNKHIAEELKLFCDTCDLAICRDCSVADHKDHKIGFIKDVYVDNKGLMDELMMKTKHYKDTLEFAVNEITDIRNRLLSNCETATNLVRSSFEQLRKELEARENLLLQQIEKTKTVKGESLQVQYDELSTQLLGVASCYDFTQKAFDSENTVAIMQLKGPITKRLMDVTGARIESKPREDDSIYFNASIQPLSESIAALGSVDSNSAFAPLSMTTTVPTSMKDKQISFLVTVKDNRDQLRSRGGDVVDIQIQSANGDLPYVINDNKNGTYSVNFVTSVEGQNRVNVLLRGVHVQNSPFYVFVSTSVDFTKVGKATKTLGKQGKSNGQFNGPRAIALTSQGKYVVVDSENHRIQFFDQNFKYLTQFGSKGSSDGQFISPSDVAINGKDQIIIADKGNNRVQVFEHNGKFAYKFGTAGNGNGYITISEALLMYRQFLDPVSVAVNDGYDYILVADQNNHRIQVFNSKGQFMFNIGSRGTGDGQFKNPTGVAVHKTTGDIVICDRLNNRVQIFDAEGKFLRKFGTDGSADGQFNFPYAVTVAPSGHLIISDQNNHRVQIFSETGQFIHKFGTKGSSETQFKDPSGVLVNSSGFIFVCDTGNNRINIFG